MQLNLYSLILMPLYTILCRFDTEPEANKVS